MSTSRREFLSRCGMGLGYLGLTSPLSEETFAQAKATHFPAKAKHVIHIFAQGAPSQVDSTNHRNGSSGKTVLTDDGPLALAVPRDRDGSFEPRLIAKHEHARAEDNQDARPLPNG